MQIVLVLETKTIYAMKQKSIFSVVAIFALLIISSNLFAGNGQVIANGNSQTSLGGYAITELTPETIKGETLRKFEITYENAQAPVTILLQEKSNCKNYIVRSNTMEIKYSCRKSGFGASILSGKMAVYSPEANSMFISAEALKNQGRISGGELDVNSALGLIACYYPALLKDINLL
jgi:hypothetical protein